MAGWLPAPHHEASLGEKMKRIISVSRRTDIPAFYGDWFMCRLADGFAGVVNPYGGNRYLVSLRPEDVTCFVFWSKDFTPFLDNLKRIADAGYQFYFNYTVTGLPDVLEANLQRHRAVETLECLSRTYSPQHINWRFDPIIISSVCDRDHFTRTFADLASRFEGLVERCFFSFVTTYNKVLRNFDLLQKSSDVRLTPVSRDFKIELAADLADIAARHGIRMYSCCGDYLLSDKIRKGHCIDGSVIESLFFPEGLQYSEKPTRPECGCTESTDIGAYDTCPHGCIYCYANADKKTASDAYNRRDPRSAFLACTKAQSDRYLEEIRRQLESDPELFNPPGR